MALSIVEPHTRWEEKLRKFVLDAGGNFPRIRFSIARMVSWIQTTLFAPKSATFGWHVVYTSCSLDKCAIFLLIFSGNQYIYGYIISRSVRLKQVQCLLNRSLSLAQGEANGLVCDAVRVYFFTAYYCAIYEALISRSTSAKHHSKTLSWRMFVRPVLSAEPLHRSMKERRVTEISPAPHLEGHFLCAQARL